jgi:hypothetical protein
MSKSFMMSAEKHGNEFRTCSLWRRHPAQRVAKVVQRRRIRQSVAKIFTNRVFVNLV